MNSIAENLLAETPIGTSPEQVSAELKAALDALGEEGKNRDLGLCLGPDASQAAAWASRWSRELVGQGGWRQEPGAAFALTIAGCLWGGRGEASDWLIAGQCRLTSCLIPGDGGRKFVARYGKALNALMDLVRAAGVPTLTLLAELDARIRTGRDYQQDLVTVAGNTRGPTRRLSGALAALAPDHAEQLGYASGFALAGLGREILAGTAPEELRARLREVAARYVLPEVKAVNLDEADDICRGRLLIRCHMQETYDFKGRIDWEAIPFDDIEANVWLNSHPDLETLVRAFVFSGNRKYLEHFFKLLSDWIDSSPVTDFDAELLQWRTLEAGKRPGRWGRLILRLIDEPELDDDLLMTWMASLLEHALYLMAHQTSGGNWRQVEGSGLAIAALLCGELAAADRWFRVAVARLEDENARAFLPDGFQAECSTLYHCFPLRNILDVMLMWKAVRGEVPQEWRHNLEGWMEVPAFMSRPDFTLPQLGDGDPRLVNVRGVVAPAIQLLESDDLRFVASRGAKLPAPKRTSVAFPHAGYYVMRSGWGKDDQQLVFDAGFFGIGHQHEDKLNFDLYAAGRPQIVDSGIYQYSDDGWERYFRGSRGHNSVTIDGLEQNRGLCRPKEQRPDPRTRWITEAEYDFAEGCYTDGFARRSAGLWSGRGKIERDMPTLDRSLIHRRRIFYVKGEYWILHDAVLGAGLHRLEQRFHLAPVITEPGSAPVPGKVSVCDLNVRSANGGLGNIGIVRAPRPGMEVSTFCGQVEPEVAGWTALDGRNESHEIVFAERAELPLGLSVVLWPQERGEQRLPSVEEEPLGPGRTALRIALPDGGHDIFLMSEGQTESLAAFGLEAEAEAVHLRVSASGEPGRLLIMGGDTARYESRALQTDRR